MVKTDPDSSSDEFSDSSLRLHTDFHTSKVIIGAAYEVANDLGHGFLEKVYENALAFELRSKGLTVRQQFPISVKYRECQVGSFFADLLVQEEILVELKTVKKLDDIHAAQCINYLKASGYNLCLLINFGKPRIDIKRVVFG